ncbi:hypothetical protein [Salmonirosea aquatica]|uniref:Secretion system C-terminal sorting domain-containing protein n=1 Tax=Salmonirosea aquatica TaxID=2654236 RepID=A0A7C9FBT6_9BACT|nr:hypothetical protein [Cytophagaceae bacterium SJW1-29]
MKNSFKSLICALALGTTVAFAGPGESAKKPTTFATVIYKNIDGGINVNVEKKGLATAAVIITNAKGDVLAREGIGRKQMKTAIKFNLKDLNDGEYKVMVASKGEEVVKEFSITSEKSVIERTLTFE